MEFAKLVGTPEATIFNWVSGRRNFTPKVFLEDDMQPNYKSLYFGLLDSKTKRNYIFKVV